VEAGTGRSSTPDSPVGATRIVDENRPGDISAIAGTTEMTAPRMQPNVLQRQHVVGDRTHGETAGQDLVEEDVEIDSNHLPVTPRTPAL
jgi:hypothetical protein